MLKSKCQINAKCLDLKFLSSTLWNLGFVWILNFDSWHSYFMVAL